MTQVSGGEAVVAALAAHGVDTIFGIPGTHNLAAYAAMGSHGIRHVSVRHEQGAGYAADGYARSTGRPGVVLTTTGPAILNAAASAAQAYSDSVPVLFISPGMPSTHPAGGNGLLHEVKDQSAAMGAVTAYSHRVASVEEIPSAVAHAFTAMTAGRPRPVHLEIPLDLLDATAEVRIVLAPRVTPSVPPPAALAAAASVLTSASAPLIIAGGGAQGATSALAASAEAIGAPVFLTANGKGALPATHPLFGGAGVQHPALHDAITNADVVLAIGTELSPADWWIGLPDLSGKQLVRLDVDPSAVHMNAPAAHALVGDAGATLDVLRTYIQEDDARAAHPSSEDRPAATSGWAEELRAAHRRDAAIEGGPWTPIVDAIAEALPARSIVAADSAMVCYYGALSNLPQSRPRSFLYPTGGGTLGFGLPAGIGAKIANPATPVLVLHGDGGIMFTIAELATAAELGIALPVVVVDNGGYGEIRNEMDDRGDPVHAVALGHPDFVALARSLGCLGQRIDDPADLSVAITTALRADRPTVLHIRETSRAADHMR